MKQIYQAPEAEIVKLNVAGNIMEGDLNIPVSGGTRPEDSDAKFNPFANEQEATDKETDLFQSSGWQ